jgi:hypothetical protein
MEYYGNIACLTYDEIVPDIMVKATYDSLKQRNKIIVFGRGGNGNKILISFESIPSPYRQLIEKKHGNIYELIAREPVLERVQHDFEAEKFYTEYELAGGGKLPNGMRNKNGAVVYDPNYDYIKKYTAAASWLNMLVQLTDHPKVIKKELKLSMAQFWETTAKLIASKNIDLPKNRIRLQEKIAQYRTGKYASLIEAWRFNNNNSSKVKEEVCEALLLEMISDGHQLDDTVILAKYNKWAAANNKPIIQSKTTIGNYRRKNAWSITYGRKGRSENYNKYGLIINRKRSSAPLLLVNSDDNWLDLFFKETVRKGNQNHTNYYKRFVLVVVLDTYNDYILGYAVGNSQTLDLVREAYLDAMYHIKELTGSWYLPHQIQTDHFGLKSEKLQEFYEGLAKFTPAAALNSRSKPIERSFGTEWHQTLKEMSLVYGNYAGFNITAKEKLNTDMREANEKLYPTVDDAPMIIRQFITLMRLNKNRQQEWKEAFIASEKSKQKAISDEQMLMRFGIAHETGNQYAGNTITNDGVVVTIDGVKYKYMVPENLYLPNVGRSMQVLYDERDMSRVLVTDGEKIRFVARETDRVSMAIADFEPGEGMLLNQLMERKKRDMTRIAEAGKERRKVLQDRGVNAQSVLQAGVLTKAVRSAAEQAAIEERGHRSGLEEDYAAEQAAKLPAKKAKPREEKWIPPRIEDAMARALKDI